MKYLITALFTMACLSPQEEATIREQNTYFYYHTVSKLCFAKYDRGIANVPCTPEVLALCPNRPQ